MATYIWCEDSSSGYSFWREMFQHINPSAVVESKGNNTNLCKAVCNLSDTENQYYVLLDNAVDNPDVLREMQRINRFISGKDNIHTIPIHSFEFILLSFSHLEQWVFAEIDDLKEKRASLLRAKELFVRLILNGSFSGELTEFKHLFNFAERKNSEQIAAKLLYEITRNTGFETNKGKIGGCFLSDCCSFVNRGADDICGLDNQRLSSSEKKAQLLEFSVLKSALKEVGLYDNGI